MHPFLSNLYLILILFGIILLLLKIHDLKYKIKTFIESVNILVKYINALDDELHREGKHITHRVDQVSDRIIKKIKEVHREE